jgi:hypothetical protein
MLGELAITLDEWYAVATAALRNWPISLVSITDVSGLMLSIVRQDDGWQLQARLRLRGRRIALGGRLLIPPAVSPGPVLEDGAADWMVKELFPTREALVAGVVAKSAELVSDLHEVAGNRWPLPRPRR